MTSRKIDTLLWFALPVLLLFLVPVGFVSNDGLGHSRSFADGSWGLNPNHLLFEPLGAWWQSLWAGSQREPVDVLKLLSALCGAAAAALVRYGVAPRPGGRPITRRPGWPSPRPSSGYGFRTRST